MVQKHEQMLLCTRQEADDGMMKIVLRERDLLKK